MVKRTAPLCIILCLLPVAAWAQAQQSGRVGLDKRWLTDPPVSETQDDAASAPIERKAVRPPAGPPRVVACSGPFAKESSHIKLAEAFNAKNVAWSKVDGPEGTQIDASVLFPKDAKRRLEVLWKNASARTDTQVVVINGQSTWVAPKGLKIGMTTAALEKVNGKPFSFRGFGGENGGRVTDWNGGALTTLAGGCKIGVRLEPGGKTPPGAALNGDVTLRSNDQTLQTAAPKVSEIIVGY
jgi:hypothetical protein